MNTLEKDQHVEDLNKGIQLKREQADEVKYTFDRAQTTLMYAYMYMGQGVTYMHFKHKDTREYIKIPKCGVAVHETV